MRYSGEKNRTQQGFSLIELLITLAIMLVVSAIVLSLSYDMTMRQASVANRSDMHSSVRGVTQILQQEISQAGRIAWPPRAPLCGGVAGCAYPYTTLTTAVDVDEANGGGPAALNVAVTEVLFDGIRLLVDVGDAQEVVAYNAAGDETFKYDHAVGAEVRPAGAFGEGIIAATSTGTVLQMFGDINDTGGMVYVEYVCNPDAAGGTLTRQEVAWDADPADAPEPVVLLRNVLPNPDGPDPDTADDDCFTYQRPDPVTVTVDGINTTFDFTLNVGVTLTAKAEFDDIQTGAEQVETKALLNVSPRNVFEAWQLSIINGAKAHVQPTPPTITALSQ
jgi:prepilin-type N-terminal cleavage/methylation domain-containing protein